MLSVSAVVASMAGLLFLIRRFVDRQSKKVASVLDACDYVVVETHPLQMSGLRSSFERNGWRFRRSEASAGAGVLSTFVRTGNGSPTLSQLLGMGHKSALLPSDWTADVDFQMKIKAHGPLSDLDD